MKFKLSDRSRRRLQGVHPLLVGIVNEAIEITKVDFGISCGLRTPQEQRKLVDAGKSKTMKSKHITGHAVDVLAYVKGEVSWEHERYDDIADAFREAAMHAGVNLRWGGAWEMPADGVNLDGRTTKSITEFKGPDMQTASDAYVDLRRSQGKRPFIDMPHFNLFPDEVGPVYAA